MKQKQQEILKEALELVPFDGWTNATLHVASAHAGFEPEYAQIAFAGGVSELVDFFLRELDEQMAEELKTPEFTTMRIRDKIELAIKTRLQIAEKHKGVIRKTASFYANPFHAIHAAPSLYKTVDAIWYAAGDTSSDFNFYTKRTSLAGVYSSTLLYWLKDRSPDHQKTWEFLSRRIDNVMQINKIKAKTSGVFSKCFKFVSRA
jgi:ubiquinone biosynthesis protein COQ9